MYLLFFIIIHFLGFSPLKAEPMPALAPEYYGPTDPEGFQFPYERSAREDPPQVSRDPLQLLAIHKKGFIHRSRREAQVVDNDLISIQETARIYSPNQSFLALSQADKLLFILYPQTSVVVHPQDQTWLFTLSSNRGLLRVSTVGQGLTIRVKPTDPQSPWSVLGLKVSPNSDVFFKYDGQNWITYLLKGQVRHEIDAEQVLESERRPGSIKDGEDLQRRERDKSPHQLELFAGQTLTLIPRKTLSYRISLPDPGEWQSPLLRSSPLLGGKPEGRLAQTSADLRAPFLKQWLGETSRDWKSIGPLISAGRWEEAYQVIQELKNTPAEANQDEHLAWEMICLFRLQQEETALALKAKISANSEYIPLLRLEEQRSLARRGIVKHKAFQISGKRDSIPVDELYLLALLEQKQSHWRDALDLWEHWPDSVSNPDLKNSYREWQRHLDQNKPWSWYASAELFWANNVLHLPEGDAAPERIAHRSSGGVRSSIRLPYLIERSDDFAIHGEPHVAFTFYQHSTLSDWQTIDAGLSLPLDMTLASYPFRFKPFFSRLSMGQGGLDRFGYSVQGSVPEWMGQPDFTLTQEQNLDINPTAPHALDALSGEPTEAIDRSVRRNTLQVHFQPKSWPGMVKVMLQSWNYRYDRSRGDSRFRFTLAGDYHWNLPFYIDLKGRAEWLQDSLSSSGDRAPVTASLLGLDAQHQDWIRLRPTLSIESEMRQSSDKKYTWNEWRWMIGAQYHW